MLRAEPKLGELDGNTRGHVQSKCGERCGPEPALWSHQRKAECHDRCDKPVRDGVQHLVKVGDARRKAGTWPRALQYQHDHGKGRKPKQRKAGFGPALLKHAAKLAQELHAAARSLTI